MSSAIARLPPDLVTLLRSNCQITSFAQAIEECVSNSIDADARAISVDINVGKSYARVSDDGAGVHGEGFASLAAWYSTSKLRSLARFQRAGVTTLGYRGEALAALAEVCQLEVASRPRGSFQTFRKVVRGGVILACGLATQQQLLQGTTVNIVDMFFNQPVRQRALLAE